jgi:membrane fusion protein (multidrug efflux system)
MNRSETDRLTTRPAGSQRKRMLIVGGITLAVLLAIFGAWGFNMYQTMQLYAGMVQPPETVAASEVGKETWTSGLTAVSTLEPVNGVTLAVEIAGTVASVHFRNGETVREGALLVQLDDTSDRAELKGLEAQYELAQSNLERTKRLVAQRLVSDEQLDAASTEVKRTEAAVQNKRALVAKKAIRAPFGGTTGIRAVNVGQFVPVGTPVVQLQALENLYATFALPQQDLREVKVGQQVSISVDTYPDRRFAGQVNAIDAAVDAATRTIRVQAVVRNDKRELRPGMYAVVEVASGVPRELVTVPKTAVAYSLYGDSVFIIEAGEPDKDGKPTEVVKRVFVTLGPERDDAVAVLEGLTGGERVVVAGHLKLQNGTKVRVDNTVLPN